ncbi:MAG: hypothetical protein NTU61_03980 [Candidatus Altiarchaeota archaeon]|nr:hypothetical protein [Candidatus Altiarchaeota archaeon]
MERKRAAGQSSLEFLMTYGWALVIIIVVLVLVWQWGFFSIGETVTPGSFGFWGVEPKDFIMHQNGILELSLINKVGANVTVIYYNVSMGNRRCTCDPGDACAPVGCVFTIRPDNIQKISMNGLQSFQGGKRFEVSFIVLYNDSRTGGVVRASSGKIWGNYED